MPQPDFEAFVTADGAYAAFERAVLSAQHSVTGGFRIFDMRTHLVSDAARAVGETWFDLLVHVLRRGVRLSLVIADFDPVYATELHKGTWDTIRQAAALVEVAEVPHEQVSVVADMHPATPGFLPWLTFLPISLRRASKMQNQLSKAERNLLPYMKRQVPQLHPVTHHQKLAVIDDHTLYIGGFDLNNRRYDTPDHDRPAQETWSDVQVILRNDPAVQEAKLHLESFRATVHDRKPPPKLTRIRRTLSTDRRIKLPFLSPKTILSEIEDAHLSAIAAARQLIYVETQFMRSKPIATAMAKAAKANPGLGLIMILPARPDDLAFSTSDPSVDIRYGMALAHEALSIIKDGFGPRAIIACPVRPVMAARDTCATHAGSPIIYVHNKVLVTDSDYAMVGSANLNGRSLRWDSEAALELSEPGRVATLRKTLHHHWWRRDVSGDWADPAQMQALWRDEIIRNGVRRPERRDGFLVPHDSREHESVGLSLPLVTEDIV